MSGDTTGFMVTQEFQVFEAGSVSVNLALNKPVTASGGGNASSATDGDIRTGCEPKGAAPYWMTVDLQSEQKVNRVNVHWGGFWKDSKPKEFGISTSTDNVNWTKVYTWNKKDVEAVFPTTSARYVRVDLDGSVPVYEIKVYGGASKK